MKQALILAGLLCTLLVSCKEDELTGDDPYGAMNREAILIHLADKLIIPSYGDFLAKAEIMDQRIAAFSENPVSNTLQEARTAWLDAYTSWQKVALWDIGPAMEHALLYNLNVYPTNAEGIEGSLQSGELYDLQSINTPKNVRGFPAIEYLLYGDNKTEAEVLASFADPDRKDYLKALSGNIVSLTTQVLEAWSSGYRDEFVNASGFDRGSSVSKLFNNTFLPYFEMHCRDAKFGFPGGLRGAEPLPGNVEGLYSRISSKQLAVAAVDAYEKAWLGMSFQGGVKGKSMLDYVAFMDERLSTDNARRLAQQLNTLQATVQSLDDNFYEIAVSDPGRLDNAWSGCQKLIPIIKVDIMSELSISITYTDTDGD